MIDFVHEEHGAFTAIKRNELPEEQKSEQVQGEQPHKSIEVNFYDASIVPAIVVHLN